MEDFVHRPTGRQRAFEKSEVFDGLGEARRDVGFLKGCGKFILALERPLAAQGQMRRKGMIILFDLEPRKVRIQRSCYFLQKIGICGYPGPDDLGKKDIREGAQL